MKDCFTDIFKRDVGRPCNIATLSLDSEEANVIGAVYMLSNPLLGQIYKIGSVRGKLSLRVNKLSTGIPGGFTVEYWHRVEPAKAKLIEHRIHEALKAFRNWEQEFFEGERAHFIETINQICESA